MRDEAKTWWLVSGSNVASSYFFIRKSVFRGPKTGGGGSHINMVYVYVTAFWGTFSRNLV